MEIQTASYEDLSKLRDEVDQLMQQRRDAALQEFRQKAETAFRERYPFLAGHVDYSRRLRLPKAAGGEGQLELFKPAEGP